MAGYIRQSSFVDGDTITAAIFNNEFNQLLNSFSNTTGHKHDGTAAEGPVIGLIGDAGETSPNNKVLIDTTNNYIEFYVEVASAPVQQLYIADGAIVPVTDSDVDLGTSSLYFKDTYTDTVTTTGNVSVGGNLTVTGTTTFNGGTITMGDAATDNVVFGADVDSHIIPDDDDTYDLGSSSQQWRNLYIDGTANLDTVSIEGDATFADSAKAIFGAGSDLQIYHDGSNSYITDNGTGNLILKGGGQILLKSPADENMIVATGNGAVGLYYDNALKLTTTSTGIDVTGTAVTDGLTVNSGASDTVATFQSTDQFADLALTDSGGTSYIRQSNGSLILEADRANASASSVALIKVDNTVVAKFASGGDISFYEDTGTTAQMTWDASADALTFTDNTKAIFGAGSDLQIFHNGVASVIQDNGTGNLFIQGSSAVNITNVGSSETYASFNENGASSLYYDNTAKLATTSTGIDVTGTVLATRAEFGGIETSADRPLMVKTDTDNFALHIEENSGAESWQIGVDADGDLGFHNSATAAASVTFNDSGNVGIGHTSPSTKLDVNGPVRSNVSSGTPIFYLSNGVTQHSLQNTSNAFTFFNNGTERMRIDISGNVGIGTDSPSALLDISSATTSTLRLSNSDTILTENQITGQLEFYQADSTAGGTGISGKIGMRSVPILGGSYYGNVADMDFYVSGQANGYASDNASLTAMTIQAASGNVGIGTTSPTKNLHIYDASGGATLKIESNTANAYDSSKIELLGGNLSTSEILLGDASSATAGRIIYRHDGNSLAFDVNGSEKARIDSSGNLLVGKTASDGTTIGAELRSSGIITSTVDGNVCGNFNRKTSDGTLLNFQKDSTTVGSIVAYAGDLIIGDDDIAIRFDTGTGLVPWDIGATATGGSARDAAIDIGVSSARFKDLYLSGTANVNKVTVGGGTDSGVIAPYNLYLTSGNSNVHIFNKADGSEKARIDGSGNFGIGTTSPAVALHAESTSAQSGRALRLAYDSTYYFDIEQLGAGGVAYNAVNSTSGGHRWEHNGSEKMRLDDSGNLGLGTTLPTNRLHVRGSGITGASASGTSLLYLENNANNSIQINSSSSLNGQIRFGDADSNYQGAITYSHSDDSLGFVSAGVERMRIDSSGNVGIGTTSPANGKLEIASGSNQLQINTGDETTNGRLAIGHFSNGTFIGTYAGTNAAADLIRFGTSGSERARIDSSGNLLVGRTSTSFGVVGTQLASDGAIVAERSANPIITLNRLSTDGEMQRFYKDGTQVGSIGNSSTQLTIDSSANNLVLQANSGNSNVITRGTLRPLVDDTDDIGLSNRRFKDLYLSGVAKVDSSAYISQGALTSSSGSVAWDAAAAANAYHVTTENTTFAAPTNPVEGAIISVEIAQGATPRTVAWNTVFEFAASTAPTVTATANKTDIFSFRYNGSVWQEIGRTQNLAQT